VTAPGRLRFFEVDEPEVAADHFAVETVYSGLSAGTELTYVKGTNPYLHSSWDTELGVFRRDRPAQGYPVTRLGYMEVARVVESRSATVAAGDLVAMAYGHKTGHVADARTERAVPVPDGIDPLLAIYVAHMGPICANGLLHAAAELVGRDVRHLGDGVRGLNVAVFGAGVVGLLVALFARRAGAGEVVVVDRTPERLDAARSLGLGTLDESDTAPWELAKQRWRHGPGDRGADVVFQCRGRTAALAEALRCLRPQGVVIDLAFYPGGAPDLHLGEEFHHNGLAVRCAQIGRVPRGLAHLWDRERLSRETIDLLLAEGRAMREHLISDVVPLDDAPDLILSLAERRRHVLQAVFAGPAA
jgi:threonine dehydrogenase-like Zn-dependent dehydrogenase